MERTLASTLTHTPPHNRVAVSDLRFDLRPRQRYHPERAPAPVDDLERGGDHDRPGRRQLIEVAQAGEPELPCSVHGRMVGERPNGNNNAWA